MLMELELINFEILEADNLWLVRINLVHCFFKHINKTLKLILYNWFYFFLNSLLYIMTLNLMVFFLVYFKFFGLEFDGKQQQ